MEYSYKGNTLLQYLKKYQDTDRGRMKMATEIVRFSIMHPEYQFEEAVDEYLQRSEQDLSSEACKTISTHSVYAPSFSLANLKYQGQKLIDYVKEHHQQEMMNDQEVMACLRSIQHFLKRQQIEEKDMEQGISLYFKVYYEKFLQTYFINHVSYQNISFDELVKFYVPQDKVDKSLIYRTKVRLFKYIKSNYNAETQCLNYPLENLIEYFVIHEYHGNLANDIRQIKPVETQRRVK